MGYLIFSLIRVHMKGCVAEGFKGHPREIENQSSERNIRSSSHRHSHGTACNSIVIFVALRIFSAIRNLCSASDTSKNCFLVVKVHTVIILNRGRMHVAHSGKQTSRLSPPSSGLPGKISPPGASQAGLLAPRVLRSLAEPAMVSLCTRLNPKL